ncbi:EF-hand domain-containing protein 1 [Sarotherodon galilaeus]
MSFFGKLKNLMHCPCLFSLLPFRHTGPPAPPRRTDNNAAYGWPEDEFDDDNDMYEAPPCERPAVKVPPREVEENVYLERTSKPGVTPRQVAPPPRPSKFSDAISKPPEVIRSDKPGRKKMPLQTVPVEEDVYLDPTEEAEDDDDDLYLEPEAACSPPPRGPMKMPPSPRTPAPAHIPLKKPSIPRDKSNFVLPPLEDRKRGPSAEERRPTFAKPPPPIPGAKPHLPPNMKEPKASPPNPPIPDTKPVASHGGMRVTRQNSLEDREWFAGDCNRKTAEDLLQRINKDGAFLIRYSSAQSTHQPYTLAVLYQEKVYNIPIRFLVETKAYALGKEGKKNEETFSSLDEMISYHKNNQLLLIDSKSQAKHTAHLTHPVCT